MKRQPVAGDWLRAHLARTDFTDECVLWPFSTNEKGFPQIANWIKGRIVKTAAVVCEHFHGPRPQGMECCHSCPRDRAGLGNRLCMNPRHLRWDTHANNMADRKRSAIHEGD